jgi:aliphatic nitrilase
MSGAEEGILEAEIDLEDCVRKKMIQDYSGHYNRPDIFTLKVNPAVPEILKFQNPDEGKPESNPISLGSNPWDFSG